MERGFFMNEKPMNSIAEITDIVKDKALVKVIQYLDIKNLELSIEFIGIIAMILSKPSLKIN